MELFIKFINFINEKLEASLIFIGDHTPPSIKHLVINLSKKITEKISEKHAKLINWIYNPSKKKKAAPNRYKNFFSFIFSPSIISIAILVSTIVFFHKEALKLGQHEVTTKNILMEMELLKKLRKPAFNKYKEREFLVDDIYFPIYIKSSNSIKRIILDLNLRASNRYIQTFFTENNSRNLDLIYDQLNLTTEEVIPHFPLTPEGKYIIKRKIKIELDILLKNLGIMGEIEEVFISQIIAA